MTIVVIKQGSDTPTGRAAGLIYAGIDEIYPIVGRYSTQRDRPEADSKWHYKAEWHRLKNKLAEIARRFDWQDGEVIVDESINTPELVDQCRIAVKILLKPKRMAEIHGGTFILARVLRDCGPEELQRPYLEIEYHPLVSVA